MKGKPSFMLLIMKCTWSANAHSSNTIIRLTGNDSKKYVLFVIMENKKKWVVEANRLVSS